MNYKNVKIDKTAKIAKQSVIIGDVTIVVLCQDLVQVKIRNFSLF